MGEQIEFPKNFNMYMSQVMEHLRQGSVVEAIDFMKKAYTIEDEDSLNVLLVSSLLQAGEYKEALQFADEKKRFYTSDEKRLLIYVEVLLENNQILQAEKHIKNKLKSQAAKYTDSWDRLDSQLTEIKKVQEDNKRKEEESIVRQLYSLASLNTLEQFAAMKGLYTLPNDRLKQLAPQLLVNPYVHPLVRATLFSLLAEREVDGTYQYLWFDKIKDVKPKDTLPVEQNPTGKLLADELDDRLFQNPSLYQLAKNEVDTLLLMLYPFEDKVIIPGEEKAWLSSILMTIDPTFEAGKRKENEKFGHILRWVEKIHSELLRFE
ncbi:hypothetical protein SAMN04488102_101280 [Alkalibacterium subtropicum]|uniref:Tetratricopeptide repeat-containing protein n=1 Tax=Alkalibacterium subtropicum TaxID=753702 RepID=A0A1I1ENY6_9LACT|nr:hypothetical protein [Alkalibacterium subtropicum]SFB88879.1 hypothetical protein SAMN04488102_101280 [Alkalibacterium subtropicum]